MIVVFGEVLERNLLAQIARSLLGGRYYARRHAPHPDERCFVHPFNVSDFSSAYPKHDAK
jgi:hypothetical protein